jgi:hypothetical protein
VSTTLGQIALHVRSKNAGPFWMTIDAFFDDDSSYQRAASSPLTDPGRISALYGIDIDQVAIYRLPAIRAIKISFPRPVVQGSINDRDLHAGQQYVPLLEIEVP